MENGSVSLYGPVFRNVEYRFAAHDIDDDSEKFTNRIEEAGNHVPIFSCNCVLNYLYGNLNREKTLKYKGPVTFGEVAYMLLNQTLVYCEILG